MGGKFDNLAMAPYLLLFIILISISVGTASALITITLAGDVIVTDDLYIGTDDPNDNDTIYFDDGGVDSAMLQWNEFDDEFYLGGHLFVDGSIDMDGRTHTQGLNAFNIVLEDDLGNWEIDLKDNGQTLMIDRDGTGTEVVEISGDLNVNGQIFTNDLQILGGCIGCMDFYQKNHLSLSVGLNDLSCDNGDPVISGGGWSPETTAWIRESWAFGSDTWRLSMTDVNGNSVTPGAFRITCADLDPND